VGADVLFGVERDRAAAFRMAFGTGGTQAVLYDLRGVVHGEFVPVRIGAEPGRAGAVQDFAGRGRGRFAAKRAGDFERHVSAGKAGDGVRGVRDRGGRGADDWAMAGRMDYRQFFVEMDFLHQHSGGNNFASFDVFTGE